MNIKNILESTEIERYLSSKFTAYNVDVYKAGEFIIIEIPSLYSLEKAVSRLYSNISKEKNIKCYEMKLDNKQITFKIIFKKKEYKIKVIKSDLDF